MSKETRLTFLVATNNQGKAKEIKEILKDLPVDILILKDLADYWQKEAQRPLPAEEINRRYAEIEKLMEETADTFEGNALIKARGACKYTGLPALADDSGLEVDYLQGAPGVYSARYAGSHGDDEANNRLLLKNLQGVPDNQRTARFVAVMALVCPSGEEYVTKGVCEGYIADEPKGENGFGYDPIFRLPNDCRTLAQLLPEEKNAISHRAQALAKMVPNIKEMFNKAKKDFS